jgi:hypothetical protein
MLVLILVLLVLAVAFPLSYGRSFGYFGWSPLGIILVVLLVLYLTGHLGRP